MSEQKNKIEELICESCGKTFGCGANNGNCWCFSIEITPPNLAQLKEQFQNCLCHECLSKVNLIEELRIKN